MAIETEFILKGEDARYDNRHDAEMRLYRTIVRFKGEPVYVRNVEESSTGSGIMVRLMYLGTSKDGHDTYVDIDANDSRLDISSLPLGFVNADGAGFYLRRRAIRSQRQGVDPNRVSVNQLCAGPNHGFFSQNSRLHSVGDAYRGIYKSMDELAEMSSGAFARFWGIGKTKDKSVRVVCHKLTPVGFYIPKEKRFIFEKTHFGPVDQKIFHRVMSQQGDYDVTTLA